MAVPVLETSDMTTAENGGSTSTTIDITAPANCDTGEILVVYCANDFNAAGDIWTVLPTGSGNGTWHLINSNTTSTADACIAAWYIVMSDSSWASQTITCEATSTAQDMVAFAARITGAALGNVINALGSIYDNAGTTSAAIPAVTTDTANCLILTVAAMDGADTAGGADYAISGSGWSHVATVLTVGGSSSNTVGSCIATRDQASSGAGVNCTITLTVSDGCTGFQFGINEYALPCQIIEKFYDNTGTVYADGTKVICINATDWSFRYEGAVGSIAGPWASDPAVTTPGAGEACFTFSNGTTNTYFLVVDPSEDSYGLITNVITPTQLT